MRAVGSPVALQLAEPPNNHQPLPLRRFTVGRRDEFCKDSPASINRDNPPAAMQVSTLKEHTFNNSCFRLGYVHWAAAGILKHSNCHQRLCGTSPGSACCELLRVVWPGLP